MSLLAELNARYTDTAFRLEVLQRYAADEAGPILRSITNDDYLRRVAEHTLAGKRRDRVHVVAWPLTPHMQTELDLYRDNVAVGETVLIAPAGGRTAGLGPDFWLFDEDTEHAEAAVMHYDPDGSVVEIEHVTDEARIDDMRQQAVLARALAVDLGEYLTSLAEPGDRCVG